MSFAREYVAASVNRYPNSCDWGVRLIAFASCNTIGIYDVQVSLSVAADPTLIIFSIPQATKIESLLLKHEAEVRCVRWIQPDASLISASADKTAIIWTLNQNSSFDPLFTLVLSAPLIVADSKLNSDGSFTSVASSTDFMISIFRDGERIAFTDVKKYVFDVRLVMNPSFWTVSEPVIAYSTDDSRVSMGFFDGDSFSQLLSLSGHEDWSRSLDYIFTPNNSLLLASASQDGFVRVWTIVEAESKGNNHEMGDKLFSIKSAHFTVSLETVLAGHEGPVYCVKFVNDRNIITASLDKTLIVWSIGEDDVWFETSRVGEVGGNNMGFMGCTFPNRQQLTTFAGYSHNGAVHIWVKNDQRDVFEAAAGFSGHRDHVTDISWEPTGKYLLSVSCDETTRLHAKCTSSRGQTWHEISRPQIHGYEINCLAAVDGTSFVSGADEKVLRVFQATKSFINAFRDLTGVTGELESSIPVDKLPLGSCVPALGLTNRAVYENDRCELSQGSGDDDHWTGPPTEETLMQSTLWPEIHKLYGHGNELFAVAVNHRKTLLVSACKSAKAEHAGLICWNMRDEFKISQKLSGHQLTVTSIKFSPSDRFLVSVSRDRTWYLYRETQRDHFEAVAFSDKKTCFHSRIIWDVSWTPDSRMFLTCSRDKKLVFWQIEELALEVSVKPLLDHVLSQNHPVMSCDILDRMVDCKLIVTFGLESGTMKLFTFSEQDSWQPLVFDSSHFFRHDLSVRKIRFKPSAGANSEITLSSCSDDRTVQIFQFTH